MQYRKLGKWGVKVSEVALGSWLTYGGSVDEKASIKQVHFALDQGINFLDTANVYAGGQAEVVIGKAIANRRREDIFLASKVFFPMGQGPNDQGLSAKHVIEQCNASLKRLKTDYLDLYQCHRFDPNTPLEELLRTMNILLSQGKIFYWGISEWPAEKIDEICRLAKDLNMMPPVSNQPCYNMLSRDIEAKVIPVSESHGMGQVVFSPLAQGILTGKYRAGQAPPADSRGASEREGVFLRGRGHLENAVLERVEKLEHLAKGSGMSLAQMSLAWILRLPSVSSVIIGATKESQIGENLKAAGTKLGAETLAAIEDILGAK